jgi:hypothetical protein
LVALLTTWLYTHKQLIPHDGWRIALQDTWKSAAPTSIGIISMVGLAALMDGLWVHLSLNPASPTAAVAASLCNDWVAALAAGAFPGLVAQPRAGARAVRRPRRA